MRSPLVALLLAAPLAADNIELLQPELIRQMEAVERAVDRSFRSTASGQPAAVGAARGIYLPGYGTVFSIEVNLVPTTNLSPFRRSYSDDEIRDLNLRKRAGLEPLRQKMRDILVAEGPGLTKLAPGLEVALAVSLFHFPWEDRTQLPKQIIIGAARGTLSGETVLTTRHY